MLFSKKRFCIIFTILCFSKMFSMHENINEVQLTFDESAEIVKIRNYTCVKYFELFKQVRSDLSESIDLNREEYQTYFNEKFGESICKNINLVKKSFLIGERAFRNQKELSDKISYDLINVNAFTDLEIDVKNNIKRELKDFIFEQLKNLAPSVAQRLTSCITKNSGNLICSAYNLPENLKNKTQRTKDLVEHGIPELQQRAFEIMINGLASRLKNSLIGIASNDIRYNDPLNDDCLYKFLNDKDVSKNIEAKLKKILCNYFSEKNNMDFVLYQKDAKSVECVEFRKRANAAEKSFAKEIYSDLLSCIQVRDPLKLFLKNKKSLVISNFMTIFNDQLRSLENVPTAWRKRIVGTGKWLVKFGPMLYLGLKKYPIAFWSVLKNGDYANGLLLGGLVTVGECALYKIWSKGICSWIFRDKKQS
ncbi:hypothetical protein K9L05_02435 [Candidatus Babeliales bacterium]|nr:hypothetical protein [Candidatus Babeliales bacterium]MCF7899483.1 hypothetical protein [Candidatus Babeliales bacterium]